MALFGPPNISKLKSKGNIPGLANALEHKDAGVRREAARALGKVGDERALDALIRALGDGEPGVREEAAEALGKVGDERALDALIRALGDKESMVCWKAADALGEIGNARGVEPLIAVLRDKRSRCRYRAAKALGKIGDEGAVEPLLEALNDYESDVSREAIVALGEIGDTRAVEPLLIKLGIGDYHVIEALVKIGPPAVELLIERLSSGAYKSAAEALGKIGDPRAIDALIEALRDEYWSKRRVAAEALVQLHDNERLSQKDKSKILSMRGTIEKAHVDRSPSDCGVHTDSGIGVSFLPW